MVILKNFIRRISSLKFAISLIIFIAIASGIGTFIPQGNLEQDYIDLFNNDGIIHAQSNELTHRLHSIKRIL